MPRLHPISVCLEGFQGVGPVQGDKPKVVVVVMVVMLCLASAPVIPEARKSKNVFSSSFSTQKLLLSNRQKLPK